jgi:hypothetical protein
MTQTKAELLQTRHQGDLKLGDADSTNYVGFKAPATVGSNLVWTLPATDGSANQFLQTNASGVLGWGTADVSSAMPLTGGTFTGDVTFDGATAGRDIVFDRSDNALEFADDAKATFGTGADLTIKHESNTTYATNITGGFYIQSNTLALRSVSQENYLVAAENGAVELFHNNTKTFETTATGIAVTGAATISTNLTVTGDLTVSGTTTTINTQTLDVEDKNVVIGKVSTPSDTTADGGGWTLKGATDKTFNWVNSTDAWTSSEHIHLGDNKKLLIGTGSDLQLYHDGTSSRIRNSTGHLLIEGNAVNTIYIRPQIGENSIVAKPNNAVELYYDDSKKLETTSGGINVTGAINVNGSALSTAPQITATTDGALTAGDPVIVKGDGEVTKVAPAYNALSPYTKSSAVTLGSHDVEDVKVIYDEALSTSLSKLIFWIAYRNQSQSDQIWLGSYNATDNSFDSSPSNALGTGVIYNSAYDTVNDKLLFTYYHSSSSDYKVASVTTSGISSFTVVDTEMMVNSGSEQDYIDITYLGSSKAAWVGPESSTNGICRILTIASNGDLSQSSGHNVSVDSGQLKYMRVAGSGNQIVVAYAKAIDSENGYCRVGTISGTSVSFGSETEFANEQLNDLRLGYDPSSGKYLFFYGKNTAKALVGTVSGTGISFGTPVTVGGEISPGKNDIAYNAKSNSFELFFQNSTYSRGSTRNAKISGTSVVLNTILDTTASSISYKGYGIAVGYLSDTVFGSLLAYRASNGELNGQEITTMELGTNVTTENFIGFAAAGASDNAAATIDVSGATNSNQSSLTAGQKYFVQNNGSLGLTAATPRVFAGTAVSATKLIVNDQAPPVSSPIEILGSIELGANHGSDNFSFTGLTTGTYLRYELIISQLQFVGGGAKRLGLQMYNGSGNLLSTNGTYTWRTHYGASGGNGNGSDAEWQFLNNEDRSFWDCEIMWHDRPNASSGVGKIMMKGNFMGNGLVSWDEFLECSALTNTDFISGVKIFNTQDGTNLAYGRATLYGYRYS